MRNLYDAESTMVCILKLFFFHEGIFLNNYILNPEVLVFNIEAGGLLRLSIGESPSKCPFPRPEGQSVHYLFREWTPY